MSNTPSLEITSPKPTNVRPMDLEEVRQLTAIINAHSAASTPRATQKPTGNVKDDPERRLAVFAAMQGFSQLDDDANVSSGASSEEGESSLVQLTIFG